MLLAFMKGGLGLSVHSHDVAVKEIIYSFLGLAGCNNGNDTAGKSHNRKIRDFLLVEPTVNGLLHN